MLLKATTAQDKIPITFFFSESKTDTSDNSYCLTSQKASTETMKKIIKNCRCTHTQGK